MNGQMLYKSIANGNGYRFCCCMDWTRNEIAHLYNVNVYNECAYICISACVCMCVCFVLLCYMNQNHTFKFVLSIYVVQSSTNYHLS